ncbi:MULTISPECIES: DUF1641 domain-containing protein [Pseudomonas]|uniref:DUF1641 domain-containing protein n=1 Tax=Pseudomonas TaxID=286 RepID=UPI00123A04C3|nr:MULTISPECIES: DUF1641 domain-containing protein [Pseudomonas]QIB52554.1 DUF1641 domain-containing protein [Pseudomonas sp. OIL-1]
MAERLNYNVKPTPIGPDAHQELDRLLQSMHEHGVLRFANDLVCSKTDLAHVLVGGLSKDGTLNAIQNLSILGMALSRIPPEQFYKVVFGMKDALEELNRHTQAGEKGDAPGISGTYKMLQDDKLWASLEPILEAVKVFADRMGKEPDKPITEFTGKPTDN